MALEVSVLASGSSGNSIYISDGRTNILIDAGLSGKEITRRMGEIGVDGSQLDAILITHEHKDHILGAGVLSRRYNLPIYANQLTWQGAAPDLGKVKERHCKTFSNRFMIGDLEIDPFSISHDAVDPVGYVIKSGKKKLGIATDMGYVSESVRESLKGLDFLIVEANHDLDLLMNGSYPWSLKKRIRGEKGHLSNDDTAALLPEVVDSNFPCILLAHLSKDNNNPKLAYITALNGLEDRGLRLDEDFKLEYTYRERPTKLYRVG